MALPIASSARILLETFRPISSRSTCRCLRAGASRQLSPLQKRSVSTAPAQYSEMEVDAPAPRPRWAQTPPAMKGSLTVKRMRSIGGRHDVNKDPRKLDQMYVQFLGPDGHKLLSEETRWLAVTHKSFDHGRRGFNDRLAFLGKRIVELQTSLNLLSLTASSGTLPPPKGNRQPFSHPAIDGVECLSQEARSSFTHHARVAQVASQYGLPEVVRWVPRDPKNIIRSGAHMVYAQAMYAIIGALALEQGSAVANQICKERLLVPLGLGQDRSQKIEATEDTAEIE